MTQSSVGLRANLPQFALLVLVNAFVGATVGMERSVLPALAEQDFHIDGRAVMMSFVAVFGLSKAVSNFVAGRLADRVGRKQVLVAGWLVAAPVPLLLITATSWNGILFANLLLGISQGLSWSAAVIMKIDLAGAKDRGLALGFNESAGYLAVGGSALLAGWLASTYGIRPAAFLPGLAYVLCGLGLSVLLVRQTHASHGQPALPVGELQEPPPSGRALFWRTTLLDRDLSAVTQAGLVNNLNDGVAWVLLPLRYAEAGLNLGQIAGLAALYPAVWGLLQLGTGGLSDRIGRKGLVVGGMLTQAAGLAVSATGNALPAFIVGQVLLGIGTAMVYPTLMAVVGDVAAAAWRGSAIGVYRLWRDLGYVFGALLGGLVADAFGLSAAVGTVAGLTTASGLIAAWRLRETLRRPPGAKASPAAGA